MIGTTVGSYRILSKLGEGGMGAVYAAEHALLRRRAAIKVLLPELSRRPEVVERFFNEARASTAIGDLGVVQVFDFGYHVDGSAFIVMELLEGEPLEARIRRVGPLPIRNTDGDECDCVECGSTGNGRARGCANGTCTGTLMVCGSC